ncbi:MAG: L-aspartate oxidase, partial [Phenylobacterium sp.]
MSRDAGVIRNAEGLTRLIGEIDELEARYGRTPELVAARLVSASALQRGESRGGHYRTDFPDLAPARRTFVTLSDIPASAALRFAAE